jgi:hypothetical protein
LSCVWCISSHTRLSLRFSLRNVEAVREGVVIHMRRGGVMYRYL